MPTLQTSLPALLFPHEADGLLFQRSSSSEKSFPLTVEVGGQTALSATLSFSADGSCSVADLATLLRDFCPADGSVESAPLTVSWGASAAESIQAVLLPCRTELTEGAADFCARSFLSLLSGPKQTTLRDTEWFSFLTPDSADTHPVASLSLVYWDEAAGALGRRQVSLQLDVPDPSRPFTFAVRPGDYQTEGGPRLVALTVEVGQRRQELRVADAPWGSAAVELLNCFGRRETLRLWEVEREAKPTRSAASFAGRYRLYRVEELTTFKGTTAPLLDGELPLVDDAVHALRLFRAEDGAELALTDAEWKHASAATEMPRATLTWREAGRTARFQPVRSARTFDQTFDQTFY